MSPKTDARQVFTEFRNETGWSDGVAWILGLLQSALSLIGFDVVLHLTEEMPNPSRDAPRAMMLAIVIGGVTQVAPSFYSMAVANLVQWLPLHPSYPLLPYRPSNNPRL